MQPNRTRSKTHLLLEPGLIAEKTLVEPVVGSIRKAPENPLLREDVPWEPRWDDMKPSVWHDPDTGRTHLWYTPFIHDSLTSDAHAEPWAVPDWPPEGVYLAPRPGQFREFALCYAYSDDGLSWVRPDLGRTAWRGSTHNSLLLRDEETPHTSWMRGIIGAGIAHDAHETDPAKRFKMIAAAPHGTGEMGLAVAYSADGLSWSVPRRVTSPDDWDQGRTCWGDAHNTWCYAPDLGRYVAFTQSWSAGGFRRRLKLRLESEDFEHWSTPEVVDYEPDVEVHTHVPFRYGDLHLALLHVVTTPDGQGDGTLDVELAVSPDTRTWTRFAPGHPVIPRGTPGTIDCGCIFAALSPVLTPQEVRLYYCGADGAVRGWRRGFWCLATLPRDRWGGYARAPLDPPGEILTHPLSCPGGELTLNLHAPHGAATVDALEESGRLLATSERLHGDGSALPVRWASGTLAGSEGRRLRLRFRLRGAVLYGFAWEPLT